MPSPALAIVDDPLFDRHHAPAGHPECQERLDAAREGLRHGFGASDAHRVPVRCATMSEIARVHTVEYIAALESQLQHGNGHLDADTFFSAGSRGAAWCAAGGVINLAQAIWLGDARTGIALVRPPGHHAETDRAMGFCLLNNVAIAAADLLARGAQRVAIVDWDVHHGNGTQHTFEHDPRVLFISLHQWPFYPGTGAAHEIGKGSGAGFTANVGLPAGSGTEAYAEAFRRVVTPLLTQYAPEFLLVSAGFDAHARDPLASMHLSAECYGAMATALIRVAQQTCAGRVLWVLEGGYDLAALSSSVEAVTRAALGEQTELADGAAKASQRAAIEATVGALRPYWPELL